MTAPPTPKSIPAIFPAASCHLERLYYSFLYYQSNDALFPPLEDGKHHAAVLRMGLNDYKVMPVINTVKQWILGE